MPQTPKAHYKSYEAQARMIRAMVAAHPEVKWNYKGKTRSFFFFFVLLVVFKISVILDVSSNLVFLF
jgi:hypothetical protein